MKCENCGIQIIVNLDGLCGQCYTSMYPRVTPVPAVPVDKLRPIVDAMLGQSICYIDAAEKLDELIKNATDSVGR